MDRREQILQRLAVVLEGVPGTNMFLRNSVDIPESRVPAIVLLDGDEVVDSDAGFARGRGPKGPSIIVMSPEVFFLNMDDPSVVGTELNEFRAKIIDAVANDAELARLSHNGDIRYGGMQTALAAGRSLTGEAGMIFAISYAMYPGTLTEAST